MFLFGCWVSMGVGGWRGGGCWGEQAWGDGVGGGGNGVVVWALGEQACGVGWGGFCVEWCGFGSLGGWGVRDRLLDWMGVGQPPKKRMKEDKTIPSKPPKTHTTPHRTPLPGAVEEDELGRVAVVALQGLVVEGAREALRGDARHLDVPDDFLGWWWRWWWWEGETFIVRQWGGGGG